MIAIGRGAPPCGVPPARRHRCSGASAATAAAAPAARRPRLSMLSPSCTTASAAAANAAGLTPHWRPRMAPAAAAAAAEQAPAAAAPEGLPQAPLSFSGRPGLYDGKGRLMLKALTLSELEEWCESIGEQRRRAMQLWRWMYADDWGWAGAPEDTIGLQNGFSVAFCEKIRGIASLEGGMRLESVAKARDGTQKLVFKLTEGEGRGGSVEAVLIPVVREAGTKPRVTLCVSSQVGCAMACQFCLTGRLGLAANLGAGQIVEQLVAARRHMAAEGDSTPITNIVFMGMGEPLHNLDAVVSASEIMSHPLGLHMSHNKVTVSTVGLVDKLDEFVERCSSAQLAVSLHATTDEIRDRIVPVNKRHDLSSLLGALQRHYPRGNAAKRRVLIEYVMLRGVNDTLEDAERLVTLLEPIEAKVNLIQFNPHPGTEFEKTPIEDVLAFRSVLIRAGRVCTIRDSRGDDQLAACGQLGDVAAAAAGRSAPAKQRLLSGAVDSAAAAAAAAAEAG